MPDMKTKDWFFGNCREKEVYWGILAFRAKIPQYLPCFTVFSKDPKDC
jgi:hypothetical protein